MKGFRFAAVLLLLLARQPLAEAQVTDVLTTLLPASGPLCLEVPGASVEDGAPVALGSCNGQMQQLWRVRGSSGPMTLSPQHSGKCLNILFNDKTPGARAVQMHCHGGFDEDFSLRLHSTGSYQLVARHSGLCLTLDGSASTPGTRLVQQPCISNNSDSSAQRWRLPGLANKAARGRWSPLQKLPLIPVAAANLPNGKVLMWSAFDRFSFGGDNGRTYTAIYDPVRGTSSELLVSNTGHDMFCPGTANLADGRLLVAGGSSSSRTSLYDPVANSWTASGPMNLPRGYQGAATLSTGEVFTIGGSYSGALGDKDAEVWSPATGAWRRLLAVFDDFILTRDTRGIYRSDNHAWLFAAGQGRVFHAGPSKQMHWIRTDGSGQVIPAGERGSDGDAMNGSATMYDIGKILTLGGANDYESSFASARAHRIDIGGSSVQVQALAPMAYSRAFASSVVLPSGQVLVLGGQTYPEPFSDDNAVLVPELWEPSTGRFLPMLPLQVPRGYHSVALLLADGRVLSGGGGLCGECSTNHPDVQIFTPPYLLNADGSNATRPVLHAIPASAARGQALTVNTDRPVSSFALMRLSSVTHTVNNEQRRVPLAYTSLGNNRYQLALPAEDGVLIPGDYYLFALTPEGVPGHARTLRIR